MTTESVRVALDGAGVMANRYHYPSLAEFPDVELVGISDLVEAKARQTATRFGIPDSAVYVDYRRMLVVPGQVTLIPLFILVVKLGWVNSYQGLIVPTLASAQSVFLMRQYIMGIPDDLIEAATLDGASEWRIFREVILPLTIPVQATLGIFLFLWYWNDFLWPLIVSQSREMQTLTVGLASLQGLVPSTNSLMAAAAISFLPSLLVFVLFQRFIFQSIATTGVKG